MKLLRMTLRAALRALRRNKLRSVLTMLGIIIGVAAVIAMVSIGQGADAAVQEQIRSLGTDLLMIVPGATTASGVRSGWGGVSTLTGGRCAGDRQGVPGGEGDVVLQACGRAGRRRRQELVDRRAGRAAVVLSRARLAGGARHGSSRQRDEDEGRAASPCSGRRGRPALRRRSRSGRRAGAHQERPLPGHRRARGQGPGDVGAGSGRRHPHPVLHRRAARARHRVPRHRRHDPRHRAVELASSTPASDQITRRAAPAPPHPARPGGRLHGSQPRRLRARLADAPAR